MMFDNLYTQQNEDGFTSFENKCFDRHQADFDYNGAADTEVDAADYFRPIRAVKVG